MFRRRYAAGRGGWRAFLIAARGPDSALRQGEILVAAVFSSFGCSGAVSPVSAAWGPVLLFGSIAGALGLRVFRPT